MRKLNVHIDGGMIESGEGLELLANIGWDGVFVGWREDFDLASFKKKCDKAGLQVQSVHSYIDGTHDLWQKDVNADKVIDRLCRCIRETGENGIKIVIVHTFMGFEDDEFTFDTERNSVGFERFKILVDTARDCGVKIAFENTEGEIYLRKLMQYFANDDAVGFCIDTGHEMCYNYSHDLITEFGDKLICTHLNDNMKITGDKITFFDDSHLLPFDGKGDWQNVADRLNKVGYKGDLTFELVRESKPNRDTHKIYDDLDFEGFARLAFEKAKKFRKMLDGE